jgi:hypothetical protein
MSYDNLANRLRDLGRRRAALDASRQAVSVVGQLQQLDTERYLPNLAIALNNFSIHLSDTGLHGQALKASQET